MIRTIVVGVDGSADSRRAVAWAAELAAALDAEVVAVHARGLLERYAVGPAAGPDADHDPSRIRFERDWCAELDGRGVRNRRVLREAAPVEGLLDVARDVGADLVVVGRRGAGGGPADVVGSTSHHVVQASGLPVVVVPAT